MGTNRRLSQGRVLLNLSPVSKGGGLQNALSLVQTLSKKSLVKHNFLAILPSSEVLVNACRNGGIDYVAVNAGYLNRLKFELKMRGMFSSEQVCFTQFGPPMLRSTGYLLNIIGVAYSNLFYPEIQFWSYLPYRQRVKKALIDEYRRVLITRADYWIFETEILRKRAIEVCGFPENRVGVVRMAASSLVSPSEVKLELREQYDKKLPNGFRFLFLSGAHPNKRLHILAELAVALRSLGNQDFVFVGTMDDAHPYTALVVSEFEKHGVGMHFANLGPVLSEDVATLIEVSDAMCNFSVLESFSNNFVEAWRMRRPLVVTDSDWARDSCGQAALYVNVDNVEETAMALERIVMDAALRHRLVTTGDNQLSSYPTAEKKTDLYLREIDKARLLGPCSRSEKKNIHWQRSMKL